MLPDIIHTPRLLLRPPRLDDAATIFQRYAQDPEVTCYLTWRPHQELAQTEALIQRCLGAWTEGTRQPWVLRWPNDALP